MNLNKSSKIFFFFALTVLSSSFVQGQEDLDDTVNPIKWIVGSEINVLSVKYSPSDPKMELFSLFRYKIAPFILYHPRENIGIGIIGEYDHFKSTDYIRNDLFGIGIMTRYTLSWIDLCFDDLNDFFSFFVGLEYRFTNYRFHEDYPFVEFGNREILLDGLQGRVIKPELGASIVLPKKYFKRIGGLQISLAYRPELYANQNWVHSFTHRIEYHW